MTLDDTQRIPVSMPWGGTTPWASPTSCLVSDAVDYESRVVATDTRDYTVHRPGCAFDYESTGSAVDADVVVLPNDSAEHADAPPVFLGDQGNLGVSKQTLLQASQPLVAVAQTSGWDSTSSLFQPLFRLTRS